MRGTLRYQGFPEFIAALVAMGWLKDDGEVVKGLEDKQPTLGELTAKTLGIRETDERLEFKPD